MKKLLKIRFAKFEKALAMQILEQEGRFVWGNHIRTSRIPEMSRIGLIYLRGEDSKSDLKLDSLHFSSNAERDEYLEKVVKWISDEQFSNNSDELKAGEMCEVSVDGKNWNWGEKRLVAVLPENFRDRYIVWSEMGKDLNGKDLWCRWAYARPIASCVQPKIDGDIYTWEMEVADER